MKKVMTDAEAKRAARRDIEKIERELNDPNGVIEVPAKDMKEAVADIFGNVEDDEKSDETAANRLLRKRKTEPIDPYEEEDDDEEDDSVSGLVGGVIGAVLGGIGGLVLGSVIGSAIGKNDEDDETEDDDEGEETDAEDDDDEEDEDDDEEKSAESEDE